MLIVTFSQLGFENWGVEIQIFLAMILTLNEVVLLDCPIFINIFISASSLLLLHNKATCVLYFHLAQLRNCWKFISS